MWHVWGIGEKHTEFWWGNLLERDYLEDLCVGRMIILKLISNEPWPRCLRRRSATARLVILWVRIPLGEWMYFCCECCVLSGRGPCDELISPPEESYRKWCIVDCDLETS